LLTALIAVAIFLIQRNTRGDRAVNSLQLLGAKVSNLDIKHGWIACEGPKFGDEHLDTLILFKDLRGYPESDIAVNVDLEGDCVLCCG